MEPMEADGYVVLLDTSLDPATTPELCRFAWTEEIGTFTCIMRTEHRIVVPEGGASAVAIVDEEGQLIYAHRPLGGDLTAHQELIIEAAPVTVAN